MGYDNSKIYKLVCDDGYYYYGSTIQTLDERLWHHRGSSKTMTSKLYSHMREIGLEKVRIELVETVVCRNRKELRTVENKYILADINDTMCLNTLRSYTSETEKRAMEKERQTRNKDHRAEVVHSYYETHKDEINDRHKSYYSENKDVIGGKQKEYNEKHKDDIKSQRKQYYDENKERLCREKREKREENKEETKQKQSEYREKNRERINQLKRDAYSNKKEIERLRETSV